MGGYLLSVGLSGPCTEFICLFIYLFIFAMLFLFLLFSGQKLIVQWDSVHLHNYTDGTEFE